jgi:hypothetical protein
MTKRDDWRKVIRVETRDIDRGSKRSAAEIALEPPKFPTFVPPEEEAPPRANEPRPPERTPGRRC